MRENRTSDYRAGKRRVQRKKRVRGLRQNQTDAERILWQRLRGGQLGSFKFRRQHELGAFVLDFYCPAAKLVVEVDGGQHFSEHGLAYDAERTAVFAASGLRVLRFSNDQVLAQIDAVLEAILMELLRHPSA